MKSSRLFNRAAMLFAAVLLVTSFSLTGCKTETETEYVNYDITGTWVSGYDEKFIISNSNLTNKYQDSLSYAGDNLLINKISDTSGYFYVKYTTAYNSSDVGKWYAVYYKDLTSNSVKLSGAYKLNGETSTTTVEQAIAEFTVANGYFAGFSECTRQ